jgi:DNA-binding MarR family transcriptional regulator
MERRLLTASEMHPTFFGVKRLHHRLLTVSRELLVHTGLTPARFDLMRIVEVHGGGVGQQKVVALLGVSPATVSRMVSSLEELGLLVRERGVYQDGRLVHLRLTEAGRVAVRRAVRRALGSGGADLVAASALSARWWSPLQDLRALDSVLTRARGMLDDAAHFVHPWRRDDLWFDPSMAELMPEHADLFPCNAESDRRRLS